MIKTNTKHELISWGKSLALAVFIAFLIRTFLFAPYIVEGASMEPTLHNHEKILVNKFKSDGNIEHGEIVIIKGQEENYVKRIIGLPGDTIEMKNDELFVNGKRMNETYLSENRKIAVSNGLKLTGDFGPLTVPKGELFVMGDNRLHSMDSRNGLGLIQKSNIIGKSEVVFFPFKNFRSIE